MSVKFKLKLSIIIILSNLLIFNSVGNAKKSEKFNINDRCADRKSISNLNKFDDTVLREKILERQQFKNVIGDTSAIHHGKSFIATLPSNFGYHLSYEKIINHSKKSEDQDIKGYFIHVHGLSTLNIRDEILINLSGTRHNLSIINRYQESRLESIQTAGAVRTYTVAINYKVFPISDNLIKNISMMQDQFFIKTDLLANGFNQEVIPGGVCPLYLYPREFKLALAISKS